LKETERKRGERREVPTLKKEKSSSERATTTTLFK